MISRYTIVLLLLVAVCYSHKETFPEVVERWEKTITLIQGECVKQTHVDTALITRWIRHGEYPDNRPFKCFIKCLADAVNAVGNDGKFVKEALLKSMDIRNPEIEKKVMDKCSMDFDINGDICQAAFDVNKCLRRATEEAFNSL